MATDTTIGLRDGAGTSFPVKAYRYDDGSHAMYHINDGMTFLPDGMGVQMMGTTMKKFSDGFSGPTVAAGAATIAALTQWTVIRNTGSIVPQITNGTLTLTSGTTANSEFLMVGNTICTIPQNLIVTLSMNGRSSNQEIRVGYLEVDAAGVPVDNPNLTGFWRNSTSMMWNGTASGAINIESMSGGNPTMKVLPLVGQTSSTSTLEYALEVRPEDVTYQQAVADTVAAKLTNGGRLSTTVPSPNVRYAPFIQVKNTGTATSTITTIQRIISMDIQELQAEVGGGRGNLAASQAIPVAIAASLVNQGISGSITVNNTQVNTGTNAGSVFRAFSAASVNATVVKSSAGKVWGGLLTNYTASTRTIKFYNKNSAPVIGTDSVLFSVTIPPGGSNGGQVQLGTIFDQYGLYFSSGIAYTITDGQLDSNAVAVGQNDVSIQLLYV